MSVSVMIKMFVFVAMQKPDGSEDIAALKERVIKLEEVTAQELSKLSEKLSNLSGTVQELAAANRELVAQLQLRG